MSLLWLKLTVKQKVRQLSWFCYLLSLHPNKEALFPEEIRLNSSSREVALNACSLSVSPLYHLATKIDGVRHLT